MTDTPKPATTLAELVEALETAAASERRLATVAQEFQAMVNAPPGDAPTRNADLMERAAKVLRASSEVHEELLQDADDETQSSGFRKVVSQIASRLEAAITRALGGSDPERATRSEVGGTARFGADEDGPEIRDDLPPTGKASRL